MLSPAISIKPVDEKHWLELRARDVTSTDISALFNCSPYITQFEMWHRKRNADTIKFEASERMKWGIRLQDAIANSIAEDNGWKVRRMDEYIRREGEKIGSSFDYIIEEKEILEIKNVDSLQFKNEWIEIENSWEAPPHIEFQIQHQLLVSGLEKARLAALVGGNKLILLERTPIKEVQESILEEVDKFWKSVMSGIEPVPDFSKDAEFIKRLKQYAEPNAVFDARENEVIQKLAIEYKAASEVERKAAQKKEIAKAKLLMEIGAAEKVLGGQFTISAGITGPCHVEYDRAGFRNFKISWKKEK